MSNSTEMKRCTRCKNMLPAVCFHVSKTQSDGLNYYCRKCMAEKRGSIWHPECLMPDGMKQCVHCNKVLAFGQFRPLQTGKYGVSGICRSCEQARNQRNNHMTPEKLMARSKWGQGHSSDNIESRLRLMEKRAGKHDLTPDDLRNILRDQDNQCAYCGIRIFLDIPYDAHIEHIIPVDRGGTNDISNLAWTCAFCNLSKNNLLLDEWMKVRGW